MDPDTDRGSEGRRTNVVRPVLIAAVVALVVGLLVGRFLWPTGDDLDIISGELGVVSSDLDAVALEGRNQSYDLTHATGVECLDGLERGATIHLGAANITTGDEDIPSGAFLNAPEAQVVLWVECVSEPNVPAEGEDT